MKSFATEIAINAPADTVWALLADAAGYPAWNTTVDRVEGTIAAGERITVHARINPGRTFPVKVTAFAAPTRMVWTGGMPLGLFSGERTFTLTATDAGIVFAMREEYRGPLAGLIGRSIPDLQPAFDEFGACLKRRAEQR
jgi:uncharacterized protein YndB with AHSA1/START domain